MTNKWRDFEYFDWDEPNPIGKYKQPMKNPRFSKGQGYPDEEVDHEGTMSYGRWMSGKGKKQRMEIRGCKNTERGKRFYVDEEIRSAAPPAPDGGKRR
jgi:hypothetical protein